MFNKKNNKINEVNFDTVINDQLAKDDVNNNPYFTNLQGYQNILDKERAEKSSWKVMALFSNFITLVAVCGAIYLGQLPDVIPMMFMQDGSGRLTALGLANEPMKIDNKMLANQLSEFIISLRQVPTSVEIKTQYVTRIKFMSTPTLFVNKFAPMLTQTYKDAAGKEIIVHPTAIYPVGKNNTWEIDWYETIDEQKIGSFIAIVSMDRSKEFKSAEAMVYNPLGLVITDININKELNK